MWGDLIPLSDFFPRNSQKAAVVLENGDDEWRGEDAALIWAPIAQHSNSRGLLGIH